MLLKTLFLACPGGTPALERIDHFPKVWKARMLLVDDYKPMNEFMKIVFEKDYDIEVALNGAEALSKASKSHFDIIISDINMPVMNGVEFYKKLTEQDPWMKDRFLFVTGNTTNDIMKFFYDNDLKFLTKPVSIDQVRQIVKELADISMQDEKSMSSSS